MLKSTLEPINPTTPSIEQAKGSYRLACIEFHNGPSSIHSEVETPLTLAVAMARPGERGFRETWWSETPVKSGKIGNIRFAANDEVMMCAAVLPHNRVFAPAVEDAYTKAFQLLDSHGYRNLFRVWNFIETINASNADGMEVYRDFCKGRSLAFEAFPGFYSSMPAATGVGSTGSGIAFALLASKSAEVEHIENSHQIPAYNYPDRYGPRSPSFARATAVAKSRDHIPSLYISGTASILGHETVFAGDLNRQCITTADNMARLVGACYGNSRSLQDATNVKAYVRHAHHLPLVKEFCDVTFGADTPIAIFNVDICRSDLLVEIEAIVEGGN